MPIDPGVGQNFAPIQPSAEEVVQFDVVPDLPPIELSIIDSEAGKAYWGYGVVVVLDDDMGLRADPVAAPYPAKASIVRCHGGLSKKQVSFVAARFGVPPVPPGTSTGTNNDVLTHKTRILPGCEVLPDGTPVFWIVGQYSYVCQIPPADTDPLLYPNSPLLPPSQTTLDPAQFNNDIYGENPDPSNFDGGAIDF